MGATTGAWVAWALVTRAATAVGTAPDGTAVAFAAGAAGRGVAVADDPHATAITNNIAVTIGSSVLKFSNRCLDM